MKSTTLIGIVLVALGIFTLLYKGFTYTTKEKIIDIGPIEATATKDKKVPLSPLFGVLALTGGITLIIVGGRLER